MRDQPILEVSKVTKTFSMATAHLTVLNEVSLVVEAGETCAVIGPSGSGKTTLLGLCAGLDYPTSGSVVLDGHRLDAMDENGRARVRNESVGFVFQTFQLIPTLTALENVMVPLELRGAQPRSEAAAWLDRVGLGDRLEHYPVQLSGGEQQRVSLARAFVHRPRILFADEPTGNLDADNSKRVEQLLFELNRDQGTALVLVTHDTELAGKTHRLIHLHGGQIVQDERTLAAPEGV